MGAAEGNAVPHSPNQVIISRRNFGTLALAAGVTLKGARAQGTKPLTIGVLNDSSATTSDLSGRGAVTSAELAIADFGPTVLARPIVLLKADHQAKADLGVSLARQWFDGDVAAIFDVGITTVALGVQQLARDKNRIVVFTSTGTVDLTRAQCSPNGIHWTYDSHSVAVGAARANMESGAKRWFFLTVDYAYGRSLEAEATEFILAHGGTVVGSSRHAIETKDFSSELLKARSSGAELIGLATPTPLIANIVKQASEFGVGSGDNKQRLAPIGLFSNDVKGIGLPLAQGLLTTEPFYWDQNDVTRAFSKRFYEREQKMPNSLQASVYGAVTHYLRAVQAAGTDETASVVAAMKAAPINDFMTHDGRIRADGRVERELFVFRVKTPEQSHSPWDIYQQITRIPGNEAFSPPSPACSLNRA